MTSLDLDASELIFGLIAFIGVGLLCTFFIFGGTTTNSSGVSSTHHTVLEQVQQTANTKFNNTDGAWDKGK